MVLALMTLGTGAVNFPSHLLLDHWSKVGLFIVYISITCILFLSRKNTSCIPSQIKLQKNHGLFPFCVSRIKLIGLFTCKITSRSTIQTLLINRRLSLGGHVESQEKKSFVFTRQASARREFSARLEVQKQSFLFS